MRDFYLKHKPLIMLWLLCIIALIIFTGHYTNLLFDVGREVYYPERILEGKVLYKDLFVIYGPFSYLWNALLYKIFSVNLGTLYFSGAVCSIGIVSGIYLIAKKFLNTSLSFAIAFFTVATGVCSVNLFNFTFPYSQAMLYGTLSFLYSLYFLIKYKESGCTKFFYLSAFLAGLAAANKYEFVIYAGVLFVAALFTRNKTVILNFITTFLAIPVICFGILFLQGLRLDHLIQAAHEISNLMNAETLKYFYLTQGVFFNPNALPVWGISILKTGIPFAAILLSYGIYDKNKVLSVTLMTLCLITAYFLCNPAVFVFLIPLLVIVSICCIKKFNGNINLLLLILSALAVSLKSFWGLTPMNYGNYYVSIILIAFFGIFFLLIDKKYQNPTAVFIVVIGLCFFNSNIYQRVYLTGKISSPHGTIYTFENQAQSANEVLSELNNYEQGVRAFIYPEGLLLNFLSKNNIKSDDYYNSLLPLYEESMGERKFTENLNKAKPELVIFNNQSTKDYYYNYICTDYALNFYSAVQKDYEKINYIKGETSYMIYQRKK